MMNLQDNIIPYASLIPCTTAFIDTHTPGSDQKQNFTIIGAGVSESKDQHVHISKNIGFNIGAAGQPPKCRNSLHTHHTAEVFFVLKGRWRFFWGRYGTTGDVILNEGDIFNIPTNMFRGFENIGQDYGMIMAILGGDDAGGGVDWAPQVIEESAQYGLILGNNGRIYDTTKGDILPDGVIPMPVMNDNDLKNIYDFPTDIVVKNFVARYWDMMACATNNPVHVIGDNALIHDRPGFDVDFLRDGHDNHDYHADHHHVLMAMHGHWLIETDHQKAFLSAGDTCLIEKNNTYCVKPSMSGEASLFRIKNNDDNAGKSLFVKNYEHAFMKGK